MVVDLNRHQKVCAHTSFRNTLGKVQVGFFIAWPVHSPAFKWYSSSLILNASCSFSVITMALQDFTAMLVQFN